MFIEINGNIWDREDYERKLLLIKKYIFYAVKEVVEPHGFKEENKIFYNEKLDLEITLRFKSRERHSEV